MSIWISISMSISISAQHLAIQIWTSYDCSSKRSERNCHLLGNPLGFCTFGPQIWLHWHLVTWGLKLTLNAAQASSWISVARHPLETPRRNGWTCTNKVPQFRAEAARWVMGRFVWLADARTHMSGVWGNWHRHCTSLGADCHQTSCYQSEC